MKTFVITSVLALIALYFLPYWITIILIAIAVITAIMYVLTPDEEENESDDETE